MRLFAAAIRSRELDRGGSQERIMSTDSKNAHTKRADTKNQWGDRPAHPAGNGRSLWRIEMAGAC